MTIPNDDARFPNGREGETEKFEAAAGSSAAGGEPDPAKVPRSRTGENRGGVKKAERIPDGADTPSAKTQIEKEASDSPPKKTKNVKKRLLRLVVSLIALFAAFGLISNLAVILSTERKILSTDLLSPPAEPYDCILVLGCGVKEDGTPTDMLYDRVRAAVTLYEAGFAPKLLMSGDHSENYNEVGAMKELAEKFGVSSEDILLDHKGYSTYESIARAAEVFGIRRAVLVTQGYHLNRALYLAHAFGIEAVGGPADLRSYRGQFGRDLREAAARSKDFLTALWKPSFSTDTAEEP